MLSTTTNLTCVCVCARERESEREHLQAPLTFIEQSLPLILIKKSVKFNTIIRVEKFLLYTVTRVYNKEGGRVSYSLYPCVTAVVTIHDLLLLVVYV